ncbi:hypothetical protein NUW58_g3341 [Xylaria curta]|uniref:Uncharacterized protein n=1 Tax=Xylaria curta TaxID=42375 RepID=A0ACC1PE36_9PEZI|nr:hypothetical protein NUW58_g3341 [Xylaria curta]
MGNTRVYFRRVDIPEDVKDSFENLLEGFRDYGDLDITPKRLRLTPSIAVNRPQKPLVERFDAIELYTAEKSFDHMYSLITKTLRNEEPSEVELEVVATLVELLTIDLYNLRLSQIGHPMYANFEGVTFRGLSITLEELEEYKAILARPELAKRNFSVPLGLLSSSTDEKIMEEFSKSTHNDGKRPIQLHLTIHIHGLDPVLLREYRRLYPDSVVSSICAMPVGHVSPHGEKEILLRGPFFHMISMTSGEINGRPCEKLVVVMMNANRDHGMEHASDQGAKERQRQCFLRAVSASKYEVCAAIAEKHAPWDANAYRTLQNNALQQLQDIDGIYVITDGHLAEHRAKNVATWLGGALRKSYPRYYAKKRVSWQTMIRDENWKEADKILRAEYEWKKRDWYNVGQLTDDGGEFVDDNLTLLHILATKPPPPSTETDRFECWQRLIDGACQPEVWMKSFDSARNTAYDLARRCGNECLMERLQPRIAHALDPAALGDLELRLHKIMVEKFGQFLSEHIFHMPQLSVLTEMDIPELWIPIPLSYGGVFVTLSKPQRIWGLDVVVYEVVVGQTWPKKTDVRLDLKPPNLDLQ